MNKKFIQRLQSYIDHCNAKIEKFHKENGDDYAEYSEEAKREIICREEELSTVKWIRDLYLEMEDEEDKNK